MTINNFLSKNIFLKLNDNVRGFSISSNLEFLLKSQYWSMAEIENFQNERLRLLIHHAYNNVEYYNQLFKELKLTPKDINTAKDLYKLPILTKSIIRENVKSKKIVARNFKTSDLIRMGSSGSTGEPLQYYVTKLSNSVSLAANIRGWLNAGYKMGDRYVKLSVNPRVGFVKKTQDFVNNCVYFSSLGVTDDDIKRLIHLIKLKKPKFIRGYPSTISLVSDYILQHSIEISHLEAIFTTGEIIFPEMRTVIKKAFHCEVFDAYSGEGGAIVFEVPDHSHYSVSHEQSITEIMAEKGEFVQSGKGEIISTDLWNFGMPFIRYAVKDIIETTEDNFFNKDGFWNVKKIHGRDVDVLVMPSGKRLIVHFFTGFFEWFETVKQFQIIQISPNAIDLKLVVGGDFNENQLNEISSTVQQYLGGDVLLNVIITDEIPPTKNGKRRFMLKNF